MTQCKEYVNVEQTFLDFARTKPVFHKFYRDDKGERHVELDYGFKPYFYVLESEEIPAHIAHTIEKVETGFMSYTDEKVKKITCKYLNENSFHVARDAFTRTWEDDVVFVQRYIIDKNIKFAKRQRMCVIDIETKLSLDTINTPEPIICITCYDNFTKRYNSFIWHEKASLKVETHFGAKIHWHRDEQSMIETLIRYFKVTSPDIITGWNATHFDMAYLMNRMKKLKINPSRLSPLNNAWCHVNPDDKTARVKIRGLSIVDMKAVYEHITYEDKSERKSLDAVSEHVLKENKSRPGNIIKTWQDDPYRLIEYNIRDVQLCVRIDAAQHLFEYCFIIQQLAPIKLEDVCAESRLIDAYILKRYHNKLVFPSKRANEKIPFQGALTFEPEPGFYKNVAVLDLKQMYSSIYMTLNISPETLCDNGEVVIGDCKFTMHKQGILPEILHDFIKQKIGLEHKQNELRSVNPKDPEIEAIGALRGGVKTIANSCYGTMGYRNFRFYNIKIPSSITLVGREILQFTKDTLEELGLKVIGGDTDSCFVKFPDSHLLQQIVSKMKEIEAIMPERYLEFVRSRYGKCIEKSYFELEGEKIFKTIVFPPAKMASGSKPGDRSSGVKKRYVGKLMFKKGYKVDELFARGFEIKRKDMPRCLKPLMNTIFEMILDEKSIDEVYDYVQFTRKRITEFSQHEIGIPKEIRRHFDHAKGCKCGECYAVIPQHVRAAIFSNAHLLTDFVKADIPLILFVKHPSTNVIAINEDITIPEELIDYNRFFEFFIESRLKELDSVEGLDLGVLYKKDVPLQKFMEAT